MLGYQTPRYTDYRFFALFFGKSPKTYCGLVKLRILCSIKGAFLCPWCAPGSAARAAARCCYLSFVRQPRRESNPSSSALYPPETPLPPPNWLTSRRGYDLKSLALVIRFLLKFAELTEYQRLCACAAGWLQGQRSAPPARGAVGAALGEKLYRRFPA